MRRFLFALLLALAASPVMAAPIHHATGTFTPTGPSPQFIRDGIADDGFGMIMNGPGTYAFTATFDHPVTGFIEPSYIEIFEIFDRSTGDMVFGTCCSTTAVQFNFPSPTTTFEGIFTYPRSSQSEDSQFRYVTTEVNFDVALWATGPIGTPIAYDLQSKFLGGLPEPTSWALMIMGFGALGAVARRRNASVLAA